MKKAYFLFPAILLAIFMFFYMGFLREHEANEEAEFLAAKTERRQELMQEAADRKRAIEEALALNAERKAAREIREATDLARGEARQAADDALKLARTKRDRLGERIEDIEEDIEDVIADIGKIEAENRLLVNEAENLRGFVTIAETNEKEYQQVLQDIQKAESAHAQALINAVAESRK